MKYQNCLFCYIRLVRRQSMSATATIGDENHFQEQSSDSTVPFSMKDPHEVKAIDHKKTLLNDPLASFSGSIQKMPSASNSSENNINLLNTFDLSNRSNEPPSNVNVSINRPIPDLISINRFAPKTNVECESSYPGKGLISYGLYTRVVNTLQNSMSTATSHDLSLEFDSNGDGDERDKTE